MKRLSCALILLLAAASGWSQDKLLYNRIFTSPYSSGSTATLELWGFADDDVQEKVNYEFKGPSVDEVNAIRVNFGSTIKAKWTLNALPSPPAIKTVYQNLTGTVVDSLGTTPLAYTGSITVNGGSAQSLTSNTTIQSTEWNLGSPWASASTGNWWATFELKPSLDAMFAYDNGLATPKLKTANYTYLPTKRVTLQLVKNNRLKVHLNQANLNGSTLSTTLTSPGGTTAATQSWQALNLWVDGVLQAPTALNKGTATATNGVRSESLSWSYVSGKKYQLQVVDQVGNSQSIWYPKQLYPFDPLGKVSSLAAGQMFTIALGADGTVWAWGDNTYGQLGNNSVTQSLSPVKVKGLSGVVRITTGNNHSVALKADGTVWTWGHNNSGQLGNNTTTNSLVPVQVVGLAGVASIAADVNHNVALKTDGSVWTWGENSMGQLGNNSTTNSLVPIRVPGLSRIQSVAAGASHTVALGTDRSVWTWGNNAQGQLGNNSTTQSLVPVRLSGLDKVVSLAAGNSHTVALKVDGSVWAWGNNSDGQLGNNSTTNSLAPLQVAGLSGVVSLDADNAHTVALKADGKVVAWGNNTQGQLGNDSTVSSLIPVQVMGLSGVISLTAGNLHTAAVRKDGTVWTWGQNTSGQLGNNSTSQSLVPVWVARLPVMTSYAMGYGYSVALKGDGTVWTWGQNYFGQLGNNSSLYTLIPNQVLGLAGVASIVAGGNHTVALKTDGTVWTWGQNNYGQLGNNSIVDSFVPVQVNGLSGVVAVAAGNANTIALKADGTVWTWGYNGEGQLGNNSSDFRSLVPIQVGGLTEVVSLVAGVEHTAVLKADGTVWTWGRNNSGRLGNNSVVNSSVPVQVNGLTGVVSLTAGLSHTVSLKADGTVWAWGSNQQGQLGDNSSSSESLVPVQVAGLTDVMSLVAGYDHTAALKVDGTVWTWGNNGVGQLGISTAVNQSRVPIQVAALPGPSRVLFLVASGYSTAAYKADGTVWFWGLNQGQFGNGTIGVAFSPVRGTRLPLQYDAIAPNLVTKISPATWTNQPVEVVLTAKDSETDVNETSIGFYKDGVWAAGNTTTLVSNSSVTFEALDLAGNRGSSTVFINNIDTLPPIKPRVTSSTLTWKKSLELIANTNDAGPNPSGIDPTTGWMVLKNSEGVEQLLNRPSITVTTNGSYSFRAQDRAGNLSEYSDPFIVNNIDNTPPELSVSSPESNQITYIGTAQTWRATGASWSDNSNLTPTGQFWFGNATPPPNPSAFTISNGTIVLSNLGLPAGTTSLYLRAVDQAGNDVVLGPYPVVVDLTPPAAPTVTASTSSWTKSLLLTATSNDDGLDKTSWQYRQLPSTTWVSGNEVTVSNNGEYRFRFQDRAGNFSDEGSWVVNNIDTTPPTLTVMDPSTDKTTFVGLARNWMARGVTLGDNTNVPPTGQYWFNSPTAPTSPQVFSVTDGIIHLSEILLPEGQATLYLSVVDAAGNRSNILSYRLVVDLTKPVIHGAGPGFTKGPLWQTSSLSITEANLDSVKTWLGSDPETELTIPVSQLSFDVSGLTTDGTYVAHLKAIDKANNTAEEEFSFVLDRQSPLLDWENDSTGDQTWRSGAVTVNVVSPESSSLLTPKTTLDPPGLTTVTTVPTGSGYTIEVSPQPGWVSPLDITLSVTVADQAGNSSGTLTKPIRFDNAAPVIQGLEVRESGTLVPLTDYITGTADTLTLTAADDSPLKYRYALKETPWTIGQPLVWSDWSTSPTLPLTLGQTSQSVWYLYGQALDAAGNLSALAPRTLRVDASTPGEPVVTSTTHPRAQAPTDAVAGKVALFRFQVSQSGPMGIQNFEWKLLKGVSTPDPSQDSEVEFTEEDLSLTDLDDNNGNEYYWLFARVKAGNGKVGPWATYPFRIDSTAPANLKVTSSTHPVPGVRYKSRQIEFQWQQPLDLTGIKAYTYRITQTPSEGEAEVGNWEVTDATQVSVQGLTSTGSVTLELKAEDWAQNSKESSLTASYDNSPPKGFVNFQAQGDADKRSVTFRWDTGGAPWDDVSTFSQGLRVGTFLKKFDETSVQWLDWSRWKYTNDPLTLGYQGLDLDANYLVVVAVEDGAGNRIETPIPFKLGTQAPVLSDYDVAYDENWNGWKVAGITRYRGSDASTLSQSGALSLVDTPLSTADAAQAVALESVPSAPQVWSPLPTTLKSDSVEYVWTASGFTGTGQGISITPKGLVLGSLVLTHPFSPQTTLAYPQVQVGPAPNYRLTSSPLVFSSPQYWLTKDGWSLGPVHSLALDGNGWRLPGPTEAAPPAGSWSVSAELNPWVPMPLNLKSGARGSARSLVEAAVTQENFYLKTGNTLVRVVHAVVSGNRLIVTEGYLQVQGIADGALKVEDLQIDTNGKLWSGPRFQSKLGTSVATGFGELKAGANAVRIEANQVVLTEATLGEGSSSVVLQNLVLEQSGLAAGFGTVRGSFEKVYSGFTLQAAGGRFGQGTRVFPEATLNLTGFGQTSITLVDVEVRLDTGALVGVAHSTGTTTLTTPYGSGAITASSFTLSSDGLTATLSATLPNTITNAGTNSLPLGVRSLDFTGTIGAAPQGQTYPGLSVAGFTFTPTSADVTASGLVFSQGTIGLPAALTTKPASFDGWTIQADGTTPVKASASGKAVLTRGPWSVDFAALNFSASGLEGVPSLVVPPALGASTITLSSVGIAPSGQLKTNPTSTGPLELQLNTKALSVPSGNLSFLADKLVISSASLARSVATPLTLQNLEVPFGATSVSAGSVFGAFNKEYSGFKVTANTSTINGANRILTTPQLSLGSYSASSVTLTGLTVSLDDDSLTSTGTATGLAVGLNTPYGSGAVTASSFTLSSDGLTATLSATLPNTITNAGTNKLPLGVRSLGSTGTIGAAPQGQTYPGLTVAGFTFTPTSADVTASGLVFSQGTLGLPAAFTTQPTSFDGWTIQADGTTPVKALASGKAVLTRGLWSVDFAALNFSAAGLEGVPSLVVPPALGASTVTLSSVGISPTGVLSSNPTSTGPLSLSLNTKALSVPSGNLSFQTDKLVISSASLARSVATPLTLQNLEVPHGATSVIVGSVAGTFSSTYSGFTVTAASSTINGANRILTSPQLSLGSYSSTPVTLTGLAVSLDDDSLTVSGTATGISRSLDSPYGSAAITATLFTLSSDGLTATLSATLPNTITNAGTNKLPLGVRSLASTGTIGAAPQGQTYPGLTYQGYSFTPSTVSVTPSGLAFESVQSPLPAQFLSRTITFNGWTVMANGTTSKPGTSTTPVASRLGTWDVEFPVLRIDASGLAGEPKITLPPSLGATEQTLGTTVVNQNGTYTVTPVATTLPLELFGWTAQASTLGLSGSNFQLSGVTIPLPGIFQSSDLSIGAVTVAQDGALVSTGNGGNFNFRGTNGFRVEGTNAKVSERGLAMGGKIFLPEALGGAFVSFPNGSIVLEPDGAIIAESNATSVALNFQGWNMTTSSVTVDRRGLTIRGASVTPLGLVPITLPDFTVYSTGELAVAGESTASGTFPLGAVTVSYSGLRFDDALHLSAQVTFPSSWGTQSIVIDDLTVTPQGKISAAAAVRNLDFSFTKLGFDAHFNEIRLSREGFRLSGLAFTFTSGAMAGKSLAIDAALLDYSGNLDLYGFSFGSFPLWGYQVTLDSLSVGPTGMGFSGGIRLADNLPIPELAGAYLRISSFKIGFNGNVQDLKVSIDQGFTFTVFDSWQLTVNGLVIDQNLLKVQQAELQLPAGFQLGTLGVSGMTLNLQTGEINWGAIAVANAKYTWNGIVLTLSSLNISKTEGLVFAGSALIPTTTGAPYNTPYPKVLQNKTLTVGRFQILPSGLPGTVTATLGGLAGPVFADENGPVVSGGSVGFDNAGGNLIFSLAGKVKLGSLFATGLNDLELDITKLVFNASTASIDALDIGAVKDFGEVPLFGYASFRPSSLRLTKTGDRDFEVNVSGRFRTGALPGALANRDVTVSQFRIASNGVIQALVADLVLAEGSNLVDGLTVNGGSMGILYNAASTPAARFRVQGKVKMGPGFMAGLSGTELNIRKLEWTGSGSLIDLDIGTAWTGSKAFFGGAAIENGSIDIAGTQGNPWTISTKGVFVFPTAGVPQGLAGQKITIGTLTFTTAGVVKDVKISLAGLNIDLFGAARLSNGSLAFSRYDSDSFRVDVGGTMTLPQSMSAGMAGLPVRLDEFAFTTKGQVLALKGSVGSPATFELFAGVRATTGSFTFSQDGIAGSGSVGIPTTMIEGLPSAIVIQKLLVGWNGALKDLEAGVGSFTVTIGGFSTYFNSLIVTEDGVNIDNAVLTLPANLGSRKVSVTNAGFNKNGGFTGVVAVSEITQDIAGFNLSLKNLSLDVGAKALRVATATVETPKIGTLNAKVQLNGTVIRPSGVELNGVGFTMPNFDYGGIAFRSIWVSFATSNNSFTIEGAAQAEITGLGVLDAVLSFTNISNVYPIGLKRAEFTYVLSTGIHLGTTGLYLNKIAGGFAYGPPGEVPADMRLAFDTLGPRLKLGVGVTSAAGSSVLQMDADFWIDVKNGAWAFNGQATVLSGLATGRLGAAFGNSIFYGTFAFNLRFVNGQVQVWIFPYQGSTVLSGTGRLTFVVPAGAILDWTYYTPDPYWIGVNWRANHIRLPGSEMPLGNIEAEFGQFRQGAGAKGWVSAFGYNLGAFVDGGGIHFNVGDYTLIRPGN